MKLAEKLKQGLGNRGVTTYSLDPKVEKTFDLLCEIVDKELETLREENRALSKTVTLLSQPGGPVYGHHL